MNRITQILGIALTGVALLAGGACGSETEPQSGNGNGGQRQETPAGDRNTPAEKSVNLEDVPVDDVTGATFHTSMGDIELTLFPDSAPKTVANFVGLAEGTISANPENGNEGYYDGTVFHRVIPDFMIQGGDPTGTGRGGPGYQFGDEIDPALKFDEPGKLAMANSGPDTNGSQFFITVAPTKWLNGGHTIFGEVADDRSQGVVDEITAVETDDKDKPLDDVVVETVTVHRGSGQDG